MKGRSIPYTADELEWLEERKEWPRATLHEVFVMLFDREDVSLANLNALMKRKGWMTGRNGCFKKGQEPFNKGKKCPEGVGGRHPNARKTQFKKGQEPHNTRYLGHERLSKDGYIEVSIAETNPHTGYGRRYVQKHVWLWEQANGPVPEGYCLKCLDGDRTNTAPSNWKAIPRGALPRLNGGRASRVMAYDSAPAELKPSILGVALLETLAKDRRKAA